MQLGLFEDHFAIEADLEATAGGRDQLDIRVRMCFPNLGRQTGGPGFVVSKRAIFDGDFHELCSIPNAT
jgi:hypothetical protein